MSLQYIEVEQNESQAVSQNFGRMVRIMYRGANIRDKERAVQQIAISLFINLELENL